LLDEDLIEQLLRAIPDATVIMDLACTITVCNSLTLHLFGYDRADLVGKPIEMLLPTRFRGGLLAHYEFYVSGPPVSSVTKELELSGLRHDGSEFPVEIKLGSLSTQGGQYVIALFRDVSQRMQLEEAFRTKCNELERAVAAKEHFFGKMSHDLRTPLNSILGFTGTLLMGLPGPLNEDQKEQLQTVERSANHLLGLINSLLRSR
jgi:PAS domain S-box-containing protein